MKITQEQRDKFKKWVDATDQLSEEDKRNEAETWIISSLNILENNKL